MKKESTSTVTEQYIQIHVKAWAEQGVIKWAVPEVLFVEELEKTSVASSTRRLCVRKTTRRYSRTHRHAGKRTALVKERNATASR